MKKHALHSILLAVTLAGLPSSGLAQDGETDWVVRVGGGPALEPSYPGADSVDFTFFPVFRPHRADEAERFQTPDDGFGFVLFDGGGFAVGPAVRFDRGRDEDDALPGLRDIGWGVELGGFAEFLSESFRLRAELRQAVSGHDGLVADFGADLIARPSDSLLLSVGPRARWADDDYMSSFFDVTAAEAAASGLAPYDADSGFTSVGAIGQADFSLGGPWGLIAYARYDRLVSDAADAPLARSDEGSRNQFGAGIGITYEFGF